MAYKTERTGHSEFNALTDTSPEVAELQVALFRQATIARRVRLMRSLSRTAIELSRKALRQARDVNGFEAVMAFVELNYGVSLGRQLRNAVSQFAKEVGVAPPDILAALGPVVDALELLRIPYYTAGSLASSAHGIPRTTVDIDLVAGLRPERVEAFVGQLQAAYYIDEQAIRRAIASRASFNLIHLETMIKVDVFIPKDRPYDREAARRAAPQPLEETENARTFFLASPEDTILTKLEWYRAGGEISERQWGDVLGVLKVRGENLDFAYLERWAEQLGLRDLLHRIFSDAAGASQS